jgi:hypothetical protein
VFSDRLGEADERLEAAAAGAACEAVDEGADVVKVEVEAKIARMAL